MAVRFMLIIVCLGAAWFTGDAAGPRKIVFDEQQIEGKIRRPQLILIKAEQRPTFAPMVMQSLAGNTSVVEFVSNSVIEKSPYSGAFRFNGVKISNYVP